MHAGVGGTLYWIFLCAIFLQASTLDIALEDPAPFPEAWSKCRENGRLLQRHVAVETNKTFWTGKISTLSSWIAYHGCHNDSLLTHNTRKTYVCARRNKDITSCDECCRPMGVHYFAIQKTTCYCLNYTATGNSVYESRCDVTSHNTDDVEAYGKPGAIGLYQKVFASNETLHHYLRCSIAKCSTNLHVSYDPVNCTMTMPGLCTDRKITNSSSYADSLSQCADRNSKLAYIDSSIQKYCRTPGYARQFWVGFHRYKSESRWDGKSSIYQCETVNCMKGGVIYSWTDECGRNAVNHSYVCEDETESQTSKKSSGGIIAGCITSIVFIIAVVVIAFFVRRNLRHKIPQQPLVSTYSTRNARIYVKAPDNPVPDLPPSRNSNTCTEVCNQGSSEDCTETRSETSTCPKEITDNENIYEPYDDDVTDMTSQDGIYDYAIVKGNENEAFDDESETDLTKAYDFAEPVSSIHLPPRLPHGDRSSVNENESKSRPDSYPADNTSDDYGFIDRDKDNYPNKYDQTPSQNSGDVIDDFMDSDQDEIYDSDLAEVIKSRNDNLGEQNDEQGLYKVMSTKRAPYEHMDLPEVQEAQDSTDDIYRVIDPHMSVRRK